VTAAGLFVGKVVAITGAASGIGRACALGAASEGARIALIDRAETQSVAAEIAAAGGVAHPIGCDVTDTEAVNQAFSRIQQETERLDVLINCAGTMGNWPKPVSGTTDADWDLVIDTNLKGMFACCRAALPMLRKSKGAIVNIASELGLVGTTGLVIYGAAKAGVIQLSRGLAVEEGPNRIRVNCVCPGPVDTPFLISPGTEDVERERRDAAAGTILGRLGTAQEIADVVLFVASSKASFMTGSVVVADGGVTAHD
jgi:NAD(P)-dependent dehydrogenase (short-subunit alcohol dehydrogenase family)